MTSQCKIPHVSIIVCTYNRASLLRRTLTALSIQETDETFEILVMDDGSTDHTREVCNEFVTIFQSLRYLPNCKNQGISENRNRGIAHARGKYIIFLDDDCTPSATWMTEMSRQLDRHKVVMGAIWTRNRTYGSLAHHISHLHPLFPGAARKTIDFLTGANLGVRRSVIDETGAFSNDFPVGEDTEFSARLKAHDYTIHLASRALVYHEQTPSTIAERIRYARSHSRYTILIRNQYRFVLRTPLILRSPILLALTAPVVAAVAAMTIFYRTPRLLRYVHTLPVIYLLKLTWCLGAVEGLLGTGLQEHNVQSQAVKN